MFRAALCFFTRIPVFSRKMPDTLNGIAVWLPVVGLIVGGLVSLVLVGGQLIFPPLLCGLIGCAFWVTVTGGLHLDGVADCGDGLLVEASPEKRLEIMKDSRLGTFGGVALFMTLLFKAGALASLATQFSLWHMVQACLLAGLLSRSMVFIAMRVSSARPGGLGETIRQGTKVRHCIIASLMVLAGCAWVGFSGWIGLGSALLATAVILWLAKKRLGGVTGDVFGCVIETVEWVVLVSFCIGL